MEAKKIKIKAITSDAFSPTNFGEYPRSLAKVRETIVDLILEKICMPNKLILFDKYDYEFVFSTHKAIPDVVAKNRVIISERVRNRSKNIHMSVYDDIVSPTIFSSDYALLIFDGISDFLISKYKKMSLEEIESVLYQIDWPYINSLPSPPPSTNKSIS